MIQGKSLNTVQRLIRNLGQDATQHPRLDPLQRLSPERKADIPSPQEAADDSEMPDTAAHSQKTLEVGVVVDEKEYLEAAALIAEVPRLC
jgi:hypothetical protein